jgi:hypothetical protein
VTHQKIEPGSPEHNRLISPSKIPAICGVGRWESAYTLWHRMKGLDDEKPYQDIFTVGLAFEHTLAFLWKEENPGWRLSRGEVQYATTEFGFPAVATPDRRASRGRHRRVVEFKIARDLSEWGDPDLDGDCPTDYALQVTAQMVLSGMHYPADLLVMGPFFKHRSYRIDYDQKVADWMIGRCREFYASLAEAIPPELDNSLSTYTTVRAMHPDIEVGMEVEIPESLWEDLRTTNREAKQNERELRGLKTKVLDCAGNAQRITCNGEVVATRRRSTHGSVALFLAA